jgi:hypothetical protein
MFCEGQDAFYVEFIDRLGEQEGLIETVELLLNRLDPPFHFQRAVLRLSLIADVPGATCTGPSLGIVLLP